MTNTKVYIHEFIDIIGHNRARYMQHMTANWSPNAQEDRNQKCYGVWATLGYTGRWPEVVYVWEHDSWDELASSFGTEAVGQGAQDPKLAKWWAAAADLRRGGFDRLLEPAPWSPTIDELCAQRVSGECYAHELIKLKGRGASDMCELMQQEAAPLAARHDWTLIGAWKTAMVNDDECILLWAIPSWAKWASFEQAQSLDPEVRAWRDGLDMVQSWQRIVLVDAPLSPLRTGRQPAREDRIDWEE